MNVAVLFGGQSPEHEVSCRSAKFIYENLCREKYNAFLIGIDKSGNYYYLKENIDSLQNCTWMEFVENNKVSFSTGMERFVIETGEEKIKIDLVIPAMHGPNGEDGRIQGLMEFVGIPYVGCNSISSAICMDKEVTKRIMAEAGVRQVPYVAVCSYCEFDMVRLSERVSEIGYPVFIKPSNMGSSVGISKANNENELSAAMNKAFEYDDKIIIEKGVDAIELEVGALGNQNDFILSTIGCIQPRDVFYDYDSKYLTNDADFYIPAPISEEKREELLDMAKKAYSAALCEGLCRIDFFMDKNTQVIYFNEINTMPGFTAISLYPKLMKYDGIEASELLDRLIDLAVERSRRKR